MKVEVGMYIRTSDGKITKFIEYDKKDKNELITDYYQYSTIWIKDVVKSSFNIVSLIEKGDYVNGHRVIFVNDNFNYPSVNVETSGGATFEIIPQKNIKSVVTKEQFEALAYKVN